MASPRLQKLKIASNSQYILLNEDAIMYVQTNSSNSNHSDITYEAWKGRIVKETFDKTRGLVLHGSESLIEVTLEGTTTLINAGRIVNSSSADGTVDGVATISYNTSGALPEKFSVSETLQDIKDAVDALVSLAASVS